MMRDSSRPAVSAALVFAASVAISNGAHAVSMRVEDADTVSDRFFRQYSASRATVAPAPTLSTPVSTAQPATTAPTAAPVAQATPTPAAPTAAPVAQAVTSQALTSQALTSQAISSLDLYAADSFIGRLLRSFSFPSGMTVTSPTAQPAAAPPAPAVAIQPEAAPTPVAAVVADPGVADPAPQAPPSDTLAAGPSAGQGAASLAPGDVGGVISRVVQEAAARGKPATIAVVDRMGAVLAVYQMANAPAAEPVMNNPKGANATPLVDGLNGVALPAVAEAIAKADTAAYLSTSHGNAFSTRTASQIIQDHFNPGTLYAPSGPLYGVQFSQLPCSDLAVRVTSGDASSLTRGPHRSPLGLAGDPGGLPLYKNGEMVGAVGVKADGSYGVDLNIHDNDHSTDEILALAGTIGFDAPTAIRADHITAGGLLLRYSDATPGDFRTNPAAAPPFASLPAGLTTVPGYYAATDGLRAGSAYGTPASGLAQDGSGAINAAIPAYLLVNGAGQPRYPAITGAGPGALTQGEASTILRSAYAVAIQTRAQIRNPAGSQAEVTISVVDVYGRILGVATTPDAPIFGIDVSLQKARSALLLSSPPADGALRAAPNIARFINAATGFFGRPLFTQGYAWSARAIGNISRDTYPDGIDGSPNGPLSLSAGLSTPFSDGLQLDLIAGNLGQDVGHILNPANPDTPAYCTLVQPPAGSPSGMPILANGLQVFPGGFPIYRGAQLIGGIGVSGDGVDQDDLISFLGLYNAGQALRTGIGHAPQYIRASTLYAAGAAPHYVNCPYAPFLNSNANNVCTGK